MNEVEPIYTVNRVKDPNNKNPLEKIHCPVIELKSAMNLGEFFNVVIKVGEVEHPNHNDHFIHWLKIFMDDLYIIRTDFAPVRTKPEISVSLRTVAGNPYTIIRAVTRCNQHGIWESTRRISLSQNGLNKETVQGHACKYNQQEQFGIY